MEHRIAENTENDDFDVTTSSKEDSQIIIESEWSHVTDDYEIFDVIGEGAFGKVVAARHKKSKKKVAIKLMRSVMKNVYNAK